MLTNLLIQSHEWILALFNKEGIFIQCLLALSFFVSSAVLIIWAVKNGQFADIEGDVKMGVFDEEEVSILKGASK